MRLTNEKQLRTRTPAFPIGQLAVEQAGPELDVAGAALAVAGLVTLTYALAGAPAHGWGSARTVLLLALALVLLAAFAAVERSMRRPLVPAQLWRTRSL